MECIPRVPCDLAYAQDNACESRAGQSSETEAVALHIIGTEAPASFTLLNMFAVYCLSSYAYARGTTIAISIPWRFVCRCWLLAGQKGVRCFPMRSKKAAQRRGRALSAAYTTRLVAEPTRDARRIDFSFPLRSAEPSVCFAFWATG